MLKKKQVTSREKNKLTRKREAHEKKRSSREREAESRESQQIIATCNFVVGPSGNLKLATVTTTSSSRTNSKTTKLAKKKQRLARVELVTRENGGVYRRYSRFAVAVARVER